MKRTPPERVELDAPNMPEIEPHALFLPEKDDDDLIGPPTMQWVSITRTKPWYENAGQVFPQEEIQDVSAIRERFGGGTFAITARDSKKRVLAKREVTVRGQPLPMDGDGAPEVVEDPRKAAQLAQVVAPASESAEAFKAMANAFTSSIDRMMAMQAEQRNADREQTKILIGTMGDFYKSIADVYKQAPSAQLPTTPADEFRAGMEYQSTLMETMYDKINGAKEERGNNGDPSNDIKEIGSLLETVSKLAGGTAKVPET